MSKVWANGLVITAACGLSLYIVVRVVRWTLTIPIAGLAISAPMIRCAFVGVTLLRANCGGTPKSPRSAAR